MAKLEIRLTPEQHTALDDSLKQYYVATEDKTGFELEGIGSIQRALAEEKARKATKPELAEELARLQAYEAEQKRKEAEAEEERTRAAGETDKWKEQYDARHKAELEKLGAQLSQRDANLKRERLTNVLTEKGVLPDRAKYLVHELDSQVELVSDDNGFSLKKKGGIGDVAEFEAMIENVKTTSPFFFAATGASGSGASGSQGNGSNGKSDTSLPAVQRLEQLYESTSK